MEDKEHWYRFYDYCDYSISYTGSSHAAICLETFRVIRHTRKGVWLSCDKWVSNDARKRYAYPTKELAWESFRIRKQHQVAHCIHRLKLAEQALELSKEPYSDSTVHYKEPKEESYG